MQVLIKDDVNTVCKPIWNNFLQRSPMERSHLKPNSTSHSDYYKELVNAVLANENAVLVVEKTTTGRCYLDFATPADAMVFILKYS